MIPILKNGGKSKKSGDIPVIFSTQTCSFDSIFQLIAACYAESPPFKKDIDENETDFAQLLKLVMTSKDEQRIDAMRNHLLTELYPERVKHIRNMLTIDVETVITDMYAKLCKNCCLLQSEVFVQGCECEIYNGNDFISFNLRGASVKNIQSSLVTKRANKRCEFCRKLVDVHRIPQEIIVFDTAGAAILNERLNDIQRNIMVGNLQYKLLGIVEHQHQRKHFVPHVLHSNNDWICYDDLKTRPSRSPATIETVVLIFYRLVNKK